MSRIKLSEWAKQQTPPISYKDAWKQFSEGKLPVKTEVTDKNRVFVVQDDSKLGKFVDNEGKFYTPVLANESKASLVRRNAAATSTPTDQFWHLYNEGVTPFNYNALRRGWGGGDSLFPLSEAFYLCQRAYYNFSAVRNIIDTMVEFSCSNIYFTGGNAKSRNFFKNFWEAMQISNLQEKFFLEYYRSSNALIYRFQIEPSPEDIARLNKTYAAKAANDITLPSKYIMINPYDIGVQSNIVFGSNVIFFKRLNGYEIHRLRAAETPEEKQFFNSLPKTTQDQINAGAGTVIIPLDPERLYGVFCKKMDYEVMSVPLIYPVLRDIEWKTEMKRIDMAAARTMQQVVLLVNMGYEDKQGNYMFDGTAAAAMQQLFASESVGKVLVADFTTKLSWVIPEISDFLDPKKYALVNQDIKEGLNYILTGGDSKFANQFISVKLFVEKLKQGRKKFLDEFLIPEMKKISDKMNFQSTPVPHFEDIDLRDEAEWERIVTQLTTIGALTASEALDAIETGKLPTADESAEHQAEYKKQRDAGMYQPLMGGPFAQMQQAQLQAKTQTTISQNKIAQSPSSPGGRPTNVNTKQKTKKVGISRGSVEEELYNESELYSITAMSENLKLASQLRAEVGNFFKKLKKIKEFTEEQTKVVNEISDVIIANCEPKDWINNIEKYVKNPVNDNNDRIDRIESIACEHQLSPSVAAILVDSIKK